MSLFAQAVWGGNQNYCPDLSTNSWYGNKYNNRSEVAQLQNFLFSYYNVAQKPTGFFGQATKKYLSMFQREQGLYPVTGGLGPLTRQAISRACEGNIVGGDRDEHGCIGSAGYTWCAVKNKCLRSWEESCSKDQVACPAIYQPVCGQQIHECCKTSGNKPSYCMYAKVNCEVGTPKTYGNSCELNREDAKYLYDGKCKNTPINNEASANCKVWYDGCNTCSRQNIGGPLMCTLMACLNNNIWNSGAYCKEYFTQLSEAPVIKNFSGPLQLRVNEKGTWSVQAEIFNNQQLNYNLTWGDEKYDYKLAMPIYSYINSLTPQNTTFEHTYTNPGTYTVTITVTGANGQSTKTTSTVTVTGNNISCYDNGITYLEGQNKSCLWINGNQTCIADASYVCRSGSWKVEGNNWWSGRQNVCSSDAKQCPNGTWVGRTGSSCEFVCPLY